MYEAVFTYISRRTLTSIVSITLTFAAAPALWPASSNAQTTSFAPAKGSATISVNELQISSKAKKEFDRGVRDLEKENAESSVRHFALAIRSAPGFYDAYYHQGVADLVLGRNEDALHAFQTATDLSQGSYPRAEFGYALALSRLGRAAEAEPVVRHGLQTGPNISDGHVVLSYVLLKLDRLTEAEASALDALRLNEPTAVKARLILADIHAREGKYEEQAQDLNAYLERYPQGRYSAFLRATRDAAQRIVDRLKSKH